MRRMALTVCLYGHFCLFRRRWHWSQKRSAQSCPVASLTGAATELNRHFSVQFFGTFLVCWLTGCVSYVRTQSVEAAIRVVGPGVPYRELSNAIFQVPSVHALNRIVSKTRCKYPFNTGYLPLNYRVIYVLPQ